MPKVHPLKGLGLMCRGSALVAMDLGFMGPNYSISTACATANYCFVAAANHIRKGDADIIIAGGSEAPIIPVGLGGFVACRCSPFPLCFAPGCNSIGSCLRATEIIIKHPQFTCMRNSVFNSHAPCGRLVDSTIAACKLTYSLGSPGSGTVYVIRCVAKTLPSQTALFSFWWIAPTVTLEADCHDVGASL